MYNLLTFMSHSLVSVIVPTKNSSRTLGACLQSLQLQTYTAIEVIVVDNSSTDNTPDIARQYTSLFFTKGPERSAQRNFGASQAKGKYTVFIDSDMKLSNTVIENCVETMERNKDFSGVIIPEESFGQGFWAQCKKLERSFYVGVDWMEAARFFRTTDILKIGGYDERLLSGEDWDLSAKMERFGSFARIPSYIYHDEGVLKLCSTIQKKFFYATEFRKYLDVNKKNHHVLRQVHIFSRYKLFFSQPKKLFQNPLIGIGMIFMKTCEFFFGIFGILFAKYKK